MYTVVRCANCERCWGIMGKTRKCPHCGTLAGDKLQIVSIADNASDLQREVAIANMPEDLRDEMREKLPRAIEIVEDSSASLLFSCMSVWYSFSSISYVLGIKFNLILHTDLAPIN